ncbi:hypothetical protein BGW39_008533 [Mortierella sp. 14UC]|nr:hypothetical protein BGW39_008533 [Mortierella sp. 14UC]
MYDSSHQQDEDLLGGEIRRNDDEDKLDAGRLAFQHVEHQLQTKLIKQIVQCFQNILDRMISMRMAAQLLSVEVRDLVAGPMNYYRRDMIITYCRDTRG